MLRTLFSAHVVCVLLLTLPGSALAAGSAPSPVPPAALPGSRFVGSGPVQLPVTFTDDGIIVRVAVGNRDADFLLDTGASTIAIDPGFAHSLGLSAGGPSMQAAVAMESATRTALDKLSVGPIELDNPRTMILSYTFQSGSSRIVGILGGCDFFKSAVIGIDFQKRTVTAYPSDTFDAAKLGANEQRPIGVGSCVPRLASTVEGVPGWFLIDTGAGTTTLYDAYVKQLHDKEFVSQDMYNGLNSAGGRVNASVYTVSDLGFGPILFRRAQVFVPNPSAMDIPGWDGIFGRNLLAMCAVYLDYTNGVAYFKPEVQ